MYATGGLKKFFRLMAILLAVASVVGLLPLSAIAEGLKGEDEPADRGNTEQMTPEGEDTRAGEVTYELVTDGNIVSGDTYLIVYGNQTTGAANCTASNMRAMAGTSSSTGTLTATAPTFESGSNNATITAVGNDTSLYEWKVVLVDSANGYYSLQNTNTSKYLAISSTSDSNLTTVDSYANNDMALWGLYWMSPRFLGYNKTLYPSNSNLIHLYFSSNAFRNYYYGTSITDSSYTGAAYSQYLYHKVEAAATTYSVHYNVNGTPDAITANTGLADGASVTLPTPSIDLTNYEQKYFIGWTTQAVSTATAIGNISPIYYVNSNSAYYTTPFTVDAAMADANNDIVLYALFGNWDGSAETVISNETVVTYERATAIEAGATYILVGGASVSGTSAYAVGNAVVYNNHYLSAVAVTIDDTNNTCTVSSANEASVLWVAASATNSNSTTGYSFYNNAVGKYIGLDSSEYLYPGDTAVAWTYTSTQRLDNQIDSDSYFYLSYTTNAGSSSSGLLGYTTSKDSTTTDLTVRLYKRVETTAQIKVPAYTGCTTVLTNPPAATYTVNYYVNGTLLSSQTNAATATLPTEAQATAGINFENYEEDAFVVWVPTTYAKGNLQNLNNITYYEAGSTLTNAQLGALANNGVVNLYALFAEESEGGATPGGVIYRPVTSLTAGKRYVVFDASQSFGALYANGTGTSSRIKLDSSKYSFYSDSTGYYIAVDETADQAYVWSYTGGYLYTTMSGYTTYGMYYTTSSPYPIYVQSSPDSVTKTNTSQSYTYGTGYKVYLGSYSNYYLLYSSSDDCIVGSTNDSQGEYFIFFEQTSDTAAAAPAFEDYTYTTSLTPLAATHNITVTQPAAGGTISAPATARAGQIVTLTYTEAEGYTFSGWTVTDSGSNAVTVTNNTFTMPDADVTVTASFTVNQYTIHYSAEYPTTGSYSHDDTYNYGAAITLPTMQQFEGYTLSWQWRQGSASGNVIEQPSTMPAYDVYAVGTYQKNSHTVTFYSPDQNTVYATKTVLYGATLPDGLADPTREGYKFTGWTYTGNGAAYTGATMPDYDLTAVAGWAPVVTAVSLSIVPNSIEIGATATATATLTVAPEAVLGTDYRITWSMSTRAGVVEFVGATQDQTSVTLRGLAQGSETITVRVTNVNDSSSVDASAVIFVGRYPVGISVTKLPDTVAYTTGSTFDPTGMEVCIEYSDGSFSAPLAASQYTVSAPSMNTASEHVNVTVTYNEDSSWTDSFEIVVYTASGSGTTYIWTPVDTIVSGEEYLIGIAGEEDGEYYAYLIMNYNPSPLQSNNYHYDYAATHSSSNDYFAYGIPAVMDADGNVVGVDTSTYTNAVMNNVIWTFTGSATGGYTIKSGTDSNRYLYTYSTSYYDLYANTSSTTWYWNTSGKKLYRVSDSVNYYVFAATLDQDDEVFFGCRSTDSYNVLQLYGKKAVGGNHTLVFYKPDGKTVAYTVTVEDGGYITAAQLTAAQNAATAGETGNFNGWDYYGSLGTGMFTNAQIAAYPVEEDCYFVANVGNPRYVINFYEQDGSTLISAVSVEQGQPLTDTLLADVNAPTMLGYEFIGWTKDGGATVVTTGDLVGYTPASDESYTAVYRAIEYTLTVHFVDGDEVGLTLPQDITRQVAYGVDYALFADTDYPATITYNNVPYDAAPQAVQGTMPANNLTVNVTYAIRTYTVTFTVNGVNYTQTVAHGACPDKAAFEAACSLPAHMDPNTSMWNSNIPYNDAFTTPVTGNVTYTLSIQYEQVTATFYTVQNNTLTDGKFTYEMQWQQSVEYNTKPTTQQDVADVVVDGTTYTFVGWIISTDGNSYDTAHVYSFADLPALTGDTYYRAVYYNTTQDSTKRVYVLVDEPVDGQDYVIVDVGASMAATDNNVEGYQYYLAPAPVTLDFSEGGTADYYCYVSNDIADEDILWHFEKSGDNWIIKSNGHNKYMTVTAGSDGYLTALTTDNQGARWSYDKTNNRLTLVTPSQTHKYLTFVGNANNGSKFGEFIGLSNKDIVMNAIEAAQNGSQPVVRENNEATRATNTLLSEGFESGSFTTLTSSSGTISTTGWTAYNAGSGSGKNWQRGNTSSYVHNGSYYAYVYTDNSYVANSYLISAPFTVDSSATSLNLSLYERVRSSSYPETFEAFFIKSSGVTTTGGVVNATHYSALASANYTNTSYAEQTGSVTGLAGETVRLVLHCTSSASMYYLYIDDITVTETVSNPSSNTYQLVSSITSGGTYIMVAESGISGTTGYAVGNTTVSGTRYLLPTEVTINSNNTCTVSVTDEPNVTWVASGDSTNGYSFYNAAVGKYMGFNDFTDEYLSVSTDPMYWLYTANQALDNQVDSNQFYYLTQTVITNTTTKVYSTSKNEQVIRLYKLVEPEYNITVTQATGGTISATPTTATAGTTITLTATPATGYTFGSWTVTDTTNNTTVTVTNNSFTMPAGNVTVSATFTYNGGSQPGSVYYEPTSTIVVGEEYLIGYKDGSGNVYLLMNYNPNPVSNNRYVSVSSNYYSYGIRAQMSGNNVVGVYNDVYANATINNAEWIFEQNGTGYYKIQSARTEDNGAYYLRIYQSTLYSDLYASNSDIEYYGHQWQWDPANNRLSFYYDYSGADLTKYVTYNATVGSYSNLFDADTTPATVQLYRKMTGSVSDRRFTLSDSATATIKLYGISEQTGNPSVSVTPNSKTIYWYDENVVWYDETAEVVQSVTLAGENHNIAAGDIQNISWSASESGIVTLTPSADGSTCTVTSAAVGNVIVTYSVTDIFGNVYTAEAQIVVQQAPMGEIPEEDETWYTGGPEYKVYIETDHFEAGEKYIIARDYTNNNNQVSISMPYFTRTNSMSTSGTYAIVYGNSTTLANCTVLKALSADTTSETSGSYEYRYKKAEDVQYNSDRTIIMPSGSIGWTPTASDTSGYYYLLSDESNSDYPYLFSNTSNSSGVYHYLNTTSSGTVRGSWSVSSTGSSSVRFSFQNYNNSGYITYDTTNNRFTVSSTQNYFYVYEKNTSAATFTTPMTLDLTTGARNVSCYTLAIGTNSSTLMPMVKENMLIKSSNEAVVSVNEDGTLNALMEGTSCVTVAIFVNGTAYMREITVRVTDTGSVRYPATTALHALRDASLYNATTNVYYSNADSVTTYTGMHYVEGTPVILYPGDSSTNNVPFVAVDPVLEDHVTWQYSSTGLMNMAEGTYMTGLRYTSSSSSSTYYNTLRLGSTNVTTSTSGTPYVSRSVTYGSNGYGSIGTGANLTIGNINVFYYMRDVETMLATGSYTGSIQSGVTYRIFKLSNITYNPGVYDDAQAGVDLFAIRDDDGDRQYISQTSAVYNEVDAGENFHLTYELVDMPADYEQNAEDCEWELREQSMIEVNGQYVPVVTGFDEETGAFIINPALDGIEWSGYIVVGYVYSFTYPGDENVHEAANYGKIYFSSGTYQMTQDDLPEFPEPGFVGLDKTAATPYGAFINTGIGKVELTNFGIPASKPVDVVLILDLSGSMDYNITGTSERKIRKAKDAAIEFANTLLEGSDNSLSIVTFSDGAKVLTGDMTPTQASFIREGSLNSAAYLINQVSAYGGTDFDSALQYAYRIMYSNYQAYGDAHSRAVVFMTDGAPGYYNNVTLDSKLNGTQTGNWNSSSSYTDEQRMQAWDYWCRGNNSSYSMSSMFTSTERNNWSSAGTNMYLDAVKMTAGTVLTSSNFTNQTWVNALNGLGGVGQAKGLGATVYTVGFDIANSDYITAQSDIGLTGTSAAAVMRSNASSASYYYDADANTDLTDVFVNIAQAIRLVAENAVTTDTISQYFDLNVNTGYSYQDSSNQTVNGTATGSNQIVYGYYELDENYNVKHDSNNQPIFHVVETVTITGTNNAGNNYEAAITSATSDLLSGNIYNSNSKKIVAKWFTYDVETKQFEWHINEGDKMEDKKMYSLSFSVRLLDEYRVDGSTYYPTNAHAELNYDDVNRHHTELEYPIPELPWAGAQVHYEFYLVNEEGQPIDSAGNVVPFSQRVVVYTGTVDKFHPGPNTPSTITYRADEILAAQGLAYTPYEPDAESSYSVTISDDSFNNGSATLVSGGATYVTGLPDHNTPYNVSGTYNYNNGAPVNTYVSFPVVFKLAINPDVIIVDYAVGVDVDVVENDLLPGNTSAAPLYAVGSAMPTSGTLTTAYEVVATANLAAGFVSKANGALTVTDASGYTLGTAQVVTSGTKNVLRFTPTEYMISNPQVVDLYCAVQGRIPAADGATVTQRQAFMYEKLTIVPANVMYYDDTYFNTTANFNNGGAVGAYINGTGNTNGDCVWQAVGTAPSALQHTSRVNDTGKDDVHGYDEILADSTGRSFGTYHTVTVPQYASGVKWPTMSFTFRGKGIEIVTDSMTETGIMSVVITRVGESTPAKRLMIDTYYSSGDLTQIPTCRVMMNSYGVYDVTISVIHNAYYSNLHGNDSNVLDATVTIDAVRVFEPIDCATNETVRGYYAMNNQAYPQIVNVQDVVIDEINLTAYNDVALYKYENGALTLADGIGAGTYAIYSTSAKKVLGYNGSEFTAYDAVASGTGLTVDNVSSNLYLWTFAESGIEAEDGFVRYTIKHASYNKYLTVAGANGAVEYGELSTAASVPATADYSNQWTLDGSRLVTGPMKQTLVGEFFRDLYYSIGYFSSFRAVATVKPGAEETNAAMNGLLMLDGGTTTDPEIYKTIGPNNEVYVMPGSALTFKLVSDTEPTGVYLEMKSPYGNEVNAYMYSSTAVLPAAEVIRTATGMYYNISDRVVWHKGNPAVNPGEDSRLYYSAPFIVSNGTSTIDIEHVISLSNIKFTFASAASSGSDPFASRMSAAEYERTVNTFKRDQWKLYSPLFDLDVHTASTSATSSNGSGISRFNEAYITVVTSTDVGGLVIRDVNGRLVNVKSSAYTDENGIRTWKLTIDRSSMKSYNVYVTTVSAVFDMENPVSFKTKVPAITVVQLPFPGAGHGVLA